jgi:hypothetical protein
MAELLSQYTDRTLSGRDDTAAYLSLFRSHREELAPLFSVVRLLRGFLVRVEPSPAFVESLGVGLQVAAQQMVHEHADDGPAWTLNPSRRHVMLGAAALGSLAWVAAVIVFGKSRTTHSTRNVA